MTEIPPTAVDENDFTRFTTYVDLARVDSGAAGAGAKGITHAVQVGGVNSGFSSSSGGAGCAAVRILGRKGHVKLRFDAANAAKPLMLTFPRTPSLQEDKSTHSSSSSSGGGGGGGGGWQWLEVAVPTGVEDCGKFQISGSAHVDKIMLVMPA